jgi:polyhydroxybutyrate depolymerase
MYDRVFVRRPARRAPALAAVAVAALLGAGCNRPARPTPPPGPSTTTTTAPDPAGPGRPGAPGAGCAGPAVRPGDSTVTVPSGGMSRTYRRHVPPGYDGTRPTALVVNLHGFSEQGAQQESLTRFPALADRQGFVTVAPNGAGQPPYWDAQLNSRDLDFIGAVLDHTAATLCIDPARVFVAGMSNGAFLTSSVACRYADRVAAIAAVGGLRDPKGCATDRPVPVIAFHGTADTFVAYNGGIGSAAARLPAPDGSGRTLGQVGAGGDERFVPASFNQKVEDVIARWGRRNGCTGGLTATAVAADVDRLAPSCPGGAEVALYRVTGGGHTWPGGSSSAAGAVLFGRTTTSISATDLAWAFFSAHAHPSAP